MASKVNLLPFKVNLLASAPDKIAKSSELLPLTVTSAVRSITLAVFSGVEKLEAVVIDNAANVWNDDNNSILAINNFITFIENS
ncbi:hypothetical protein BSPCLSOX_1790 [uncultured Gammaproteobacteria bacterium]|nr:hypothetical protein BSPCLSOX_1790 [uncultured Gammaproteobacteria bacterium]